MAAGFKDAYRLDGGHRIDYPGRSLVVSGDARADAPNLVKAAQDADILIHEALSPRLTRILGATAKAQGQDRLAQIFQDIESYHTTPAQTAQLAKKAKVRALVLTIWCRPRALGCWMARSGMGRARSFPGPCGWRMMAMWLASRPMAGSAAKNLLR